MEELENVTIKHEGTIYDLIDEAEGVFVFTNSVVPGFYIYVVKPEVYRLIGQNFNKERGFILSTNTKNKLVFIEPYYED